MNYARMIDVHENNNAVATVAAVEVPTEQASAFGVIQVDEHSRIVAFHEKPAQPVEIPGRPGWALVNMGVYCFETEELVTALDRDAAERTRHDFGHDILPAMVATGRLFAYPFVDENRKAVAYWRDIGTIASYFEASMDLICVDPVFNLYDGDWPLRTMPRQLPPAKTVHSGDGPGARRAEVLDSIVCGGAVISGGRVESSILGPQTRVNSYASVRRSVLMDGVNVGRHARVQNAIVDKWVRIPPGEQIGIDLEKDRERFTVDDSGVVVVPRCMDLEAL
jgi:glucose-1-phosphate adenylyltransferase